MVLSLVTAAALLVAQPATLCALACLAGHGGDPASQAARHDHQAPPCHGPSLERGDVALVGAVTAALPGASRLVVATSLDERPLPLPHPAVGAGIHRPQPEAPPPRV
jgi:hypothetical protein